MSQIAIFDVSAINPNVPTSVESQDGTAIPAAKILIVDAFDSTENNDNGITTKGGTAAGDPPNTGAGDPNEVSVYLTNRISGSATTTDNVTVVPLITPFDLGGTPATYVFTTTIAVFNETDSLSAGYVSYRTIRTTGGVAVTINPNSAITSLTDEEGTMEDIFIDNDTTGNTITLTAIGLDQKTINYSVLITYVKV